MPRDPALTGLRALPWAAVALCHARVPGFQYGWLGVQAFFALSGYLVGRSLARERAAVGRIDIGRFYWRRLARLAPALWTMIALASLGAVLLWPRAAGPYLERAIAPASLFVMDLSVLGGARQGMLNHVWSVGVEMHCYLLAPLLALYVRRFHTLLIAAGLCALLYLLPVGSDGPGEFGRYLWWGENPAPFLLGTALARREWACAPWLARLLSAEPIVLLGTLSYGSYLWGWPLAFLFWNLPTLNRAVLALTIPPIISAISYLTVERWAGCAKEPLWRPQEA